jgi:hypothetical protein
MKLFVSHASDDQGKRIAVRFKELIERCSHQARVFLSSDWESIPSGALWLQAVENALSTCDYFVALVARQEDADRLWVTMKSASRGAVVFFPRSSSSAASNLN